MTCDDSAVNQWVYGISDRKEEAMHIFVTGATGVLGKAVVSRLLADGHAVCALSRSEANTEVLQRLGAKPVPADLFDAQALVQVLAGCQAEAILHLATSIPPMMQVGRRSAWLENDRIRREGARTLVEAALAAGTVSTFIFFHLGLIPGMPNSVCLASSGSLVLRRMISFAGAEWE